MFKIIKDSEISRSDQHLHTAWDEPKTFIVLPEKTLIDQRWLKKAWEHIPAELRINHFGLLTSGSTGHPKLVIGSKERARLLVQELHKRQQTEAVKQTILVLPLNYCYAFVNQWVWAKIHGRELVFTNGFTDPSGLQESLSNVHSASICLIGGHTQFIQQYFANCVFEGVIRINFAGGLFPQDRIPNLLESFPNARVFNNYGCTEAMPRLTVREWTESADANNIGMPLSGVALKTNDSDQLQFRSPYSSVGYYDGENFTVIEANSWTKTGDLASKNPDGTWLILGRNSEVFKRFGEKVSLPALKSIVESIHEVQCQFYLETSATGEHAHVLVLTRFPDKTFIRKLLKTLRINFSRVHWPIRIEAVETFPTLPNGKIDKLGLSQLEDKTVLWTQRGAR